MEAEAGLQGKGSQALVSCPRRVGLAVGKREGWSAHPRGSSVMACMDAFLGLLSLYFLVVSLTFYG